jgi:hypothetical protein
MSVAEPATGRWRAFLNNASAILFGDRIGLALFFASVCLFGAVWRTEIFITDSYALVNGLYNLTNGELYLVEAAYGPGLDTPGVERANGGRIARNYGAIVLSLPIWVLLEALTVVTDLRVALVGLYSLTLLAFGVTIGRLRDSESVVLASSLLALAFFAVNVALATPLDPAGTHLYALQVFHLLVAAFAPVLLYRLVARIESPTVGIVGATMFLLGTPLAIWAPVPKRHAITVTVVLVVAYALYRSRECVADGRGAFVSAVFRAIAYASVGLYAWVQAPEALTLLVVLALVDLPTAPDNRPRTLATIGAVFALSLVPFFVTNQVLIGSPLKPPRLLARAGAGGADPVVTGGGSGAAGSGSGTSGSRIVSVLSPALAVVSRFTQPLELLVGEIIAGIDVLLTRPEALYHTFIRSSDAAAALDSSGRESGNLTILESAPVLAAITGGVPALWRRRDSISLPKRVLTARTVVDVFAVVLVLATTFQYASRLPTHAQLTVRYLLVLYPLGIYLLVRLPVVRRTLADKWRVFAWTTAATVLIGGQLLAVGVFWTAIGLGAAIQLHGIVGLAAALPLSLWALVGRSEGLFGVFGAILLGGTTALSLVFTILVTIEYYPLGNTQLLPVIRALAEVVTLM